MGTGALQLLSLISSSPPPPRHNLCSQNFWKKSQNPSGQNNHTGFSFSPKAGGRVGGSEWERSKTSTSTHEPHRRSRPSYEFDFYEDEFGLGNARKQRRKWWSEDSSPWDTDIDDDDELLDGLGILEGSIGFSSIFKVLGSFGWMIPPIILSMLLGTGTDTFFMALVLPLAQSALSLLFDSVWGRPTNRHRTTSKSQKRKRTSAGATSSSRMKEEKQRRSQNGKRAGDYWSWGSNNISAEKGEERARNFGGWDELDRAERMQEETNTARANQTRRDTEGKLSRRARNRHTPLLVRLLIAFFPFLGFWSKLL